MPGIRSKIEYLAIFVGTLLLILFSAGTSCADTGHGKPVVYFGVNLRYDPIVIYKHYQPMMDYLTLNTPYRFELRISRDYQEGIKHLVDGKTQIASLGDGAVTKAMISQGVVPILKPLNSEGKPLYRCYLVVAGNSKIKRTEELRGKRIALGYHHSLTGNLIARQLLQSRGIVADGETRLINRGKHSSVAKAVLKGEADAGLLKDVVAKIYLPRGLRIIDASEYLPSTPIVASPRTSPELIRDVTWALSRLDRLNPRDQKILSAWDEEYRHGFLPAATSDYIHIVRLYHSIPYGCGAGCHK